MFTQTQLKTLIQLQTTETQFRLSPYFSVQVMDVVGPGFFFDLKFNSSMIFGNDSAKKAESFAILGLFSAENLLMIFTEMAGCPPSSLRSIMRI